MSLISNTSAFFRFIAMAMNPKNSFVLKTKHLQIISTYILKSLQYQTFKTFQIMKTNTNRLFEVLACLLLTFSLMAQNNNNAEELNYWIPFQLESEATSINTTDLSIMELTNAEKVFSVEYVNEEGVVAALFSTKTTSETFDGFFNMHSRLNGVVILDVFQIEVMENTFLVSSCQGTDGSIYYNTCYSFLRQNPDELDVESFWNRSQYQRNGTYLNYEIKSTSLNAIKDIIEYALDRADDINVLNDQSNIPQLPKFYVASLNFSNRILDLEFSNPGQISGSVDLKRFTRSIGPDAPTEDEANINLN